MLIDDVNELTLVNRSTENHRFSGEDQVSISPFREELSDFLGSRDGGIHGGTLHQSRSIIEPNFLFYYFLQLLLIRQALASTCTVTFQDFIF